MRHFGAYAYSVPFVPLYPCYGVRDREGEPSLTKYHFSGIFVV